MPTPVSGPFFLSNTNVIILDELTLASTGAYINDATVTVTIKDENDTELTGETWPLTMSYVTGSDGKYAGAVSSSVSVSAGDLLSCEVTATSGGNTGFWDAPLRVKARTG